MNNKSERILITGSTGLLGTQLSPFLEKKGRNIITHSQGENSNYKSDLSERMLTCQILDKIQPSVIINLAGLTSVELCENKPSLAFKANTIIVDNIVHWIESSEISCHLVQISTDHLYDGRGPHNEEAITLTNNYAFSKFAGELAAGRVSSTVLRTNFVGRSQVTHRESLTDWLYNSLTNEINVEVLDDVYFSPLTIDSLIEMIDLVIKEKPMGVFNLGSNEGMSKADFDFAFAEMLRLPTKFMKRIQTNQAKFLKAYRPKDMRMNISKFEQMLNIKLPRLEDLIMQVVKEYDGK